MNNKPKVPKQAPATVFDSVRPVLVLVTICAVAGVLLGLVHSVTAPAAERIAQERAQLAYAELIPGATSFEDVECTTEGCTAALKALDDAGNVVAYVIVAQSKGYGGQVPIAVGIDTEGNVVDVMVMSNSETPGLGTKVAHDSYIDQYVGFKAEPVEADDIDMVSGATISSKAVLAAFNIATQAYEEVR